MHLLGWCCVTGLHGNFFSKRMGLEFGFAFDSFLTSFCGNAIYFLDLTVPVHVWIFDTRLSFESDMGSYF